MFGIPTILSTLVLAALPTSPDTTLLYVTTPGCVSCDQVAPLVQELQQQGYPTQIVDAAQLPEVAQRLGVNSFPTFLMLSGGEIVDRVVGGGDPIVMKPRILRMFESAAEHQQKKNSPQAPAVIPAVMPPTMPAGSVVPAFTPNTGPPSIVPAAFTAPPPKEWEFSPIASSVKLRVDDEGGHSWGTGTIIDTRNGEALILTCGHIFRESQGKGNIEVHLFNKNSSVRVYGHCLHYDLDLDLALVYFIPPCPVRAIPVAPAACLVRTGQQVLSVGCDGGADPTVRTHSILSTDRISRRDIPTPFHFIQISGAPVGGRSGGGLFGEEGYLLGVCNTADPVANDGHFVPPHIIRHFLQQKNLSAVYETPSRIDPNPIQRTAETVTAAPKVASFQPFKPLTVVSDSVPMPVQGTPPPSLSAGISDVEQATLDEIKRRTQDGDEVILIVRSRRNPEVPSDVIVLNGISDQFLEAVAKQPKPSGPYGPVILPPAAGAVPVTYPVLHR